MSSTPTGAILTQIDRLFGEGSVAGLGERALLDRFISRRDEAAFEAIVARHGPLVLGVCRRALRDPADIEDAFQATFLILVKKAGQIRDRDGLGPWLYGVARRVATRARTDATKRRDRERAGAIIEAESTPPDADRGEFRAVIDEELDRLPEKYRTPILLCYLEGLTHEEAAERLRWPVGTVRSRMAWARDRLRDRLTRRGLAWPALLAGSAAASEVGAAVPLPLIQSTIGAAMAVAAADGALTAIVSATVASMTLGGLRTMSASTGKMIATTLLVLCGVTGGAVVIARSPDGPVHDSKPGSRLTGEAGQILNPMLDLVAAKDKEIRELETKAAEARDQRQKLLAGIQDFRAKFGLPVDPPPTPAVPVTTSRPPVQAIPPANLEPFPTAPVSPASPATQKTTQKIATPKSGESRRNRVANGVNLAAVVTPDGNRIAVYSEDAPLAVYRAPKGVRLMPTNSESMVVCAVQGKAISQLAAYSIETGRWAVQDLKEPVEGTLEPFISLNIAVTRAGRYLCAFNGTTGIWAVADMGEAFRPEDEMSMKATGMGMGMGMRARGTAVAKSGSTESGFMKGKGGEQIALVVNPSGAACRAGRHAFGYSTQKDEWAEVDLGESTGGAPKAVGSLYTVSSNKGLYVFNTASGKWDGINLADDQTEDKAKP